MAERYLGMLLTSADVARRLAAEEGCNATTARGYVAEALRRMGEAEARDRPSRKARMRASLSMLYAQAMAHKDYRAALGCLREICKLDGLYEAVEIRAELRTEIAVKVEHMTTGERRARLADLLAKHGAKYLPAGELEVQPAKPNGSNGTNGMNGTGHG